jgi:glycosyltransferase involved in cell wall biosynthesis
MPKPTYSVVIPTLNEEQFLPKLLESLSVQKEKNFEVIVVDGTSTDRTIEAAREFSRKLPELTILSSRPSLPLQRNIGASKARGEWLAFIDADSVLMPYFFERVTLFIASESPSLFTTWLTPDSVKPGEALIGLLGNMTLEGAMVLRRPFTPGPLTFVRKDAFESIGGYDVEHRYNEDVDFGQRLAKLGIDLKILRETLYIWSMRRIRKEGAFKVANQYLLSAVPMLVLNKSVKYMPGYTMGGQLYTRKRKPIQRPVFREFEVKVRKLVKELFD